MHDIWGFLLLGDEGFGSEPERRQPQNAKKEKGRSKMLRCNKRRDEGWMDVMGLKSKSMVQLFTIMGKRWQT